MVEAIMTPLCFYHKIDFDGKCSAAIVKFYEKEVNDRDVGLCPIDYGDTFPWENINKNTIVYMVDFSLQPFENMLKLKDKCGELIWIDHHKSVFDNPEFKEFNEKTEGLRTIDFAGCELTWKYLFPNKPIPYGVRLLGRYDVWDKKCQTLPWNEIMAFQYGMKMDSQKPDAFIWVPLLEDDIELIREILGMGEKVLKYEITQNREIMERCAFETEIEGFKAIAANVPSKGSQAFCSVWNPEKYDIMMPFYWEDKGNWVVSLYSDKADVDCSIIAKKYKGGGHKGASGFRCDELPFELKNVG